MTSINEDCYYYKIQVINYYINVLLHFFREILLLQGNC